MRRVDPRDTTWEVDETPYRVSFWRPVPQPMGSPTGFASEGFEITGSDVEGVIAWADATAGSKRTYALYALVRCREGELGLVRLAGADPLRRREVLG